MTKTQIVCSKHVDVPEKSFWDAISLWNYNTHYINRRLIGSKELFRAEIILFNSEIDFLTNLSPLNVPIQKVDAQALCTHFNNYESFDSIKVIYNDDSNDKKLCLYIFLLLPKVSSATNLLQVCLIDKVKNKVYYKNLSSESSTLAPNFLYGFNFTNKTLEFWIDDTINSSDKSVQWLSTKVFSKIEKWALEAEKFETSICKSLSLVSVDEYCTLYQELKLKYAAKIIEVWPENTDPLKFVYEDVAIATYLILIWRQEMKSKSLSRKPRFVDLGCGNGLLVYILNQEGYEGKGIDVRSRKIWKIYPPTVILEVSTITPSSQNLFPDYDWLIGNHSDELTPWIPVIAARSSVNCNYFLLPCCAYDFNGQKYQRVDSSKSQYAEYLEYVEKISNICQYQTLKDKLRIPSTKRICLIGIRNSINQNYDDDIQKFIDERCNGTSENDNWAKDFVARSNVGLVRNCTKLDKSIVNEIIKIVTQKLLDEKNYILNEFGNEWNKGGRFSIKDLVSIIPSEQLRKLKNECGGLQTLLKNHHFIFQVVQGFVEFRIPSAKIDNKNAKKTQCWFQLNHPNGCPVSEDNCRYKHC